MSKTIGNMTLKATPVGNDAIAIADSEDSDKTKKVLLSSISGGGSNVHIIENVTEVSDSSGLIYTGTAADVTAYEDNHLYVFYIPTSYSTKHDRYININSLGVKRLWFNNDNNFDDTQGYPKLAISTANVIVIYRSITQAFHLVDTTNTSIKENIWCSYLHCGASSIIDGSDATEFATIKQKVGHYSYSSYAVNFRYSSHSVWIFDVPVTALTILHIDCGPMWEKEIQFTTDSTFTMTATELVGKWIGVNTTATFDPNTTYVVKIKNGYGYIYKVA